MRRFLKEIILISHLFFNCLSFAQGEYIDSVPVSNSNGESYALYLPDAYDAREALPILIAFAPDGIGKHGVAPFKEIADARKMIVVSSNNSRNGPYEQNFGFAQRLFDHIFSQYNIDPDQIFLAGFSGGSRLASAIASLSDNIAGVIACGAGFSGSPDHSPQNVDGFTWLGIVGDSDFNYQEMLNTSGFLKKFSYPHSLQVFSGDHKWPPEKEMAAAFRFMELQLHRKGKITLSRKRIEEYFEEDCLRLSNFKTNKDLVKTEMEYNRMISGYSQVRLLDSLYTEKKLFLQSPNYKKKRKEEDKALNTELALQRKLGLRFNEDLKEPDRANWKTWKKEIGKLKETSESPAINRMHKRVLFWLYIKTIAGENPRINKATDAQLLFAKKIQGLIRE